MNAFLPPGYFSDIDVNGPRFREVGDLTLDRVHRDGRVDDRWLGLHPREFALLWRLAEQPGVRLTQTQLLAEALRLQSEPLCQSVAATIMRLRAKLAAVGLARLIATDGDGGYFLIVSPLPTGASPAAGPGAGQAVLDSARHLGQSQPR